MVRRGAAGASRIQSVLRVGECESWKVGRVVSCLKKVIGRGDLRVDFVGGTLKAANVTSWSGAL